MSQDIALAATIQNPNTRAGQGMTWQTQNLTGPEQKGASATVLFGKQKEDDCVMVVPFHAASS